MLFWLAACQPPPTDQQRYLDALAVQQPADLSACGEIADAELKGDCQLALSERMFHTADWCPQVESEPWRGECWFKAAEGARDAQKWDLAVRYCAQAGPFVAACQRHLWQPQLDRLLLPYRGADFSVSLEAARQMHQGWLPLLGDALTQPFWFNYARSVFRHAPHADIGWCEQLDAPHRAGCQNALRQLQASPPPQPPQRRGRQR